MQPCRLPRFTGLIHPTHFLLLLPWCQAQMKQAESRCSCCIQWYINHSPLLAPQDIGQIVQYYATDMWDTDDNSNHSIKSVVPVELFLPLLVLLWGISRWCYQLCCFSQLYWCYNSHEYVHKPDASLPQYPTFGWMYPLRLEGSVLGSCNHNLLGKSYAMSSTQCLRPCAHAVDAVLSLFWIELTVMIVYHIKFSPIFVQQDLVLYPSMLLCIRITIWQSVNDVADWQFSPSHPCRDYDKVPSSDSNS
jgi:hypothetical protein